MSKKLISKEAVLKAIKDLVLSERNPTVAAIRMQLQNGSATTIYKYLNQWKQKCFKNMINCENSFHLTSENITLEEKNFLKIDLNKQIARNENYAQELINAEKANVSLKEEIHQLQSMIQKLQLKLVAIKVAKNCLEQINKEIQNKLDINSNETIQKMQKTIDGLRLELKNLNETSINSLRETSNQGHEALMQERVVSINLQTKIDNLTKELLESKKQLQEAIMTAQVQNRSLLRQNEQLQKIVQEHGLDKSSQLEDGASLKFSKEVAVYGK